MFSTEADFLRFQDQRYVKGAEFQRLLLLGLDEGWLDGERLGTLSRRRALAADVNVCWPWLPSARLKIISTVSPSIKLSAVPLGLSSLFRVLRLSDCFCQYIIATCC